jgi:predicted nucleic acid-binding protein
VVPVIWALEVANVAARAEANSLIRPELTMRFLERLEAMPIRGDGETYERAFTDTLALARSHKLTAYDASYLELARRLDIPLATLDGKLQKAAKKAGVRKLD